MRPISINSDLTRMLDDYINWFNKKILICRWMKKGSAIGTWSITVPKNILIM